MNTLPSHLLDDIFFRLDPKSLVRMRCTNRSMVTHISNDCFKTEYLSQMGSSLLHISGYGSNLLCFHPFGDSRPFQRKGPLESLCHILGYCSGLLLISVDGCFCVANPLTKKFRFLARSQSERTKCLGFTVDQIDGNTQRFKVVCIIVSGLSNPSETMYGFQIYAGGSWRLSKTEITCLSSDLKTDMKPVYFHGGLYWLCNDGKILTFNHETEQARLIPITLDQQVGTKLFLGAGDNKLMLLSATEEVIYVYAYENILTDPKWILTRRIMNEPVHQRMLSYWNVEAFDEKRLVVRTMNFERDHRLIYDYDLRTNKWGVVGSHPFWCDGTCNFYQFKPSWSSVIGLRDPKKKLKSRLFKPKSRLSKSQRVTSVEDIMQLINTNMRS